MAKTILVDGNPEEEIQGTVVTAALLNALNNHHHTGIDADGEGALPYAADTGAANAYVVDLSPALAALITGMPILFKVANANTGASTLNVNGLGAKAIKKFSNEALVGGDIAAGQIVVVAYDGTNFQLVSPGKPTIFGSYSSRRNFDTSYLAATDGFVVAGVVVKSSGAWAELKGISDAADPPTIKRAGNFASGALRNASIMMPVDKGKYYKVTTGDDGAGLESSYYWFKPIMP